MAVKLPRTPDPLASCVVLTSGAGGGGNEANQQTEARATPAPKDEAGPTVLPQLGHEGEQGIDRQGESYPGSALVPVEEPTGE